MIQISKNEVETKEIAKDLAVKIKDGGLLCLYGDLGSGKTTFTKGLATALEINDFVIKSPTYTYIRKHASNLYHIDLYRIEEVDELLWQEISELLEDKNNIIIIEWADKLLEKLPKSRVDVYFEYIDQETRKIKIGDERK